MQSNSQQSAQLPLTGIRIVDLCDSRGQSCGRMLADLGAEVILVEPIGGMSSRKKPPLVGSQSLHFITHNANKLSVEIDLASSEGKSDFLKIVHSSDILIDGGDKAVWKSLQLDNKRLRGIKPDLIILSISDFGLHGPYKDFIATESVHVAMSTLLSRSGTNGSAPLLPPGELALETASIQGAWVALLAYWQRMHTGKGDLLDFSINDAIAQTFDPGVGASGSAAAGRTAIEVAPHGRPEANFIPGKPPSVSLMYPVFKCVDGFVRICILNPRQWQSMSKWLGKDHPFTHPKFNITVNRFLKLGAINTLLSNFFSTQTRLHLVEQGQQRGIPIAAINLPCEVLDSEHFKQRDFFHEIKVNDKAAKVPSGYVCIDGHRIGVRSPSPVLGANTLEVLATAKVTKPSVQKGQENRRPLEGLVVLDLGIIVAGGELGRLLADQGASVIKIENKTFPDGLRQSLDNNAVPISFAQANRNKKSLGLNLRDDKGKDIFLQLVKKADVVISNFKPGTMESLGLGYDVLREANSGIICAESSAMGSTGPLAKTMGYGPLVRASTGLSGLWRYPEKEMGFGDGVTIFPDHFAARVSASAILAKLIQRKATGRGGFIDTSQGECIINSLSTEFLRESIEPGSLRARGNQNEFDAPNSIFPCAGDDQWCAISVTNDEQWRGLCRAMNRDDLINNTDYQTTSGRLANRKTLDKIVTLWCQSKSPYEVMNLCQEQGTPAGNMLRLSEFLDNNHYNARKFFRKMVQSTTGREIDTENSPVGFSDNLPLPSINPAPVMAEHTQEIMTSILGLSEDEVDQLVSSGVLETAKKVIPPYRQKIKTVALNAIVKSLFTYHGFKSTFKNEGQTDL